MCSVEEQPVESGWARLEKRDPALFAKIMAYDCTSDCTPEEIKAFNRKTEDLLARIEKQYKRSCRRDYVFFRKEGLEIGPQSDEVGSEKELLSITGVTSARQRFSIRRVINIDKQNHLAGKTQHSKEAPRSTSVKVYHTVTTTEGHQQVNPQRNQNRAAMFSVKSSGRSIHLPPRLTSASTRQVTPGGCRDSGKQSRFKPAE